MQFRLFIPACLTVLFLSPIFSKAQTPTPKPAARTSAKPASSVPNTAAAEAKQPTIVTKDIYTAADNQTYLGPWMSYISKLNNNAVTAWTGNSPGDEPSTIFPNDPLEGFGNAKGMCGLNEALCTPSARDIFIIHVIDWTAATDQAAVDPRTNQPTNQMALVNMIQYQDSYWYFYRRDSKGVFHSIKPKTAKDGTYTLPNIYDVDNGYIISISRLKTTSTEINLVPPGVAYTVAVTSSLPNWLTGIETIVSKMTGVTIPPTQATPGPSASLLRTDQYHKVFIKIQQLSASTIKRPFSLAISATASTRAVTADDKSAVADANQPKPADNVLSASPPQLDCSLLNPQSNCTFQTSAAVQARDFVLFGIGIVPHGPLEIDYSTNSSGVQTSTTTNRNNFYGLVDFTPLPAHLPMNKYPYLQVGLPLTGAAWHAPYAGIGVPIPWPWLQKTVPLSVFGGPIVLKQQNASGVSYTNVKFLWGIEVPLSALSSQIQSVTGNKKSGGGS